MNNYHLKGIKCPICGSEGPFIVDVQTQVLMFDDRLDGLGGDYSWGDNAYMRCFECDQDGLVRHFRTRSIRGTS